MKIKFEADNSDEFDKPVPSPRPPKWSTEYNIEDPTLDDAFEAFKRFLLSCGYVFNRDSEIGLKDSIYFKEEDGSIQSGQFSH